MKDKKLLFVCLGNICRSPTAEAVAVAELKKRGLNWFCDSAGTSGYHDGEKADPRSISHAAKRGYDVTSISRKVTVEDFKTFDHIYAMDRSNLENLKRICPQEYLHKLSVITDHCTIFKVTEVPDPYFGGADLFESVIDILEDSVGNAIEKIQNS
ncbi:low molecular weight protein-tyrosine-phosphatase [Bdellovibrio sp. NC01]|uniref:low molecular weight protein-tyrosine-phosphatase n=1 Tax=Bdellovibrio sp. NC01 TaxID=2220073 RepID=UPI001158960A|nr:low molecular weight protein-tyrosine-phosphatase [Bdellovibrio sp. NC01]QDK39337.1 low molecular weight phosphotyrosine protein phosphatase [Bdellovibrio sp. NC01]